MHVKFLWTLMIQSGLVWKLYLAITLLEKHQGDFMTLMFASVPSILNSWLKRHSNQASNQLGTLERRSPKTWLAKGSQIKCSNFGRLVLDYRHFLPFHINSTCPFMLFGSLPFISIHVLPLHSFHVHSFVFIDDISFLPSKSKHYLNPKTTMITVNELKLERIEIEMDIRN